MPYVKKLITAGLRYDPQPNFMPYIPRLKDVLICEFCNANNPVLFYAAHRMSNLLLIDCWRWRVCLSCSKALDADDWVGMEIRMIPSRRNDMLNYFRAEPPATTVRASVRMSLAIFQEDVIRG